MKMFPAGSRPTMRPNPDYFTGTVLMDPIIDADAPARLNAVRVSFEPGARTAWHRHYLGQTLHVLSGVGLFCTRGEAPKVIRPGDTVWIPEGEEHWHGAAPDTAMVHLAMQEKQGDSATEWLDKVSDDDYLRAPEG